MTYRPNFNDPRVRKNCIRALDWVNSFLSVNNEQWLSYKEINKHLSDHRRPLGKFLRHKLLICVNAYYDPLKSICKTYRLNLDGYNEICLAVNHKPKFQVSQRIEQELITGEFEYETKSNRDFTPAQFLPKQTRRSVLENYGYRFHYDIEAAAPTLLLQQAQKLSKQSNTPLLTPGLENYINNRSQVRKEIALECRTSENNIKLVINAVLQGASLSKSQYSSILRELHWDYSLVLRLQNNKSLRGIRNDIKSLWGVLRGDMPVRYLTDKNGLLRKRSLTGRDKSGYYRSLEEQVGVVIKRYLKRDKNNHLWIHDGWSCKKIIDDVELIQEVQRQTGFVIKLDREIFDQ